jgi:CheY-like chemotaxis protein
VFERFRQEERGGAKGLGLGLAIVKHLVGEHGGTVWAESGGRGAGAIVGFELPRSAETLATEEESQPRPHPHPDLESGDLDLAGIHVLLVEDDPDGRELAATILARYGAQVTTATDAGEALERLETMRGPDRPRLLLSDIGLPDMNGMELIGHVRALASENATILAVALTAYASRQDATRALAAGFDAHVAKPVEPGALARVIATLRSRIAPIPAPSSAA